MPSDPESGVEDVIPSWLKVMLAAPFHDACSAHDNQRRNEMNYFCIDCLHSLCFNCLQLHEAHRKIQVRRYMYRGVVNVTDMNRFYRCSEIQKYQTNNNRVVYLKPKLSQQRMNQSNGCLCCQRQLTEPDRYHYCCLECKTYSSRGSDRQTQVFTTPPTPSPPQPTVTNGNGNNDDCVRTTVLPSEESNTKPRCSRRKQKNPHRACPY